MVPHASAMPNRDPQQHFGFVTKAGLGTVYARKMLGLNTIDLGFPNTRGRYGR